jgi:hypothetical protein
MEVFHESGQDFYQHTKRSVCSAGAVLKASLKQIFGLSSNYYYFFARSPEGDVAISPSLGEIASPAARNDIKIEDHNGSY